jgi:uroporphyrin-III C-methyltransferase/precorrin-2 dehydrogenase/sirohydrochlorin ferrochelatase
LIARFRFAFQTKSRRIFKTCTEDRTFENPNETLGNVRMRYFPIFIDLKGQPVAVVGGGEDAVRKIRLLLKTEAAITVIAPSLHEELAANPRVNWISRGYDAGLLEGARLVFSADKALHDRVADDARAMGIPVNAADNPDISSFIVPSIVDRDPVVVAIGTEGTAPVLGQGLRARLDAMLPQRLGDLARAGARLRKRVAQALPAGSRRRGFWQRFFFGDVREAYLAGDSCAYRAGVERLFAEEAPPPRGRVSFVAALSADPELLTLKAQRRLQEADVIVHDTAVAAAILETARRDAARIAVAGGLGDGAADILVAEARNGKLAVRLTAREPALEDCVAIAAEGIAFEVVPAAATETPARPTPFPTREDIRDAILRVAS